MPRSLSRRLLACTFLLLLGLLTVVTGYASPLGVSQLAASPTTSESAPAQGLPGPGTIPDLILWLDAADPDADGNPGNHPADSSALPTWEDKSGFNNDASVLTGQSAGTFRSGGGEPINGNPVVRFTRANHTTGSVYTVPGVDIRATTHEDVTLFTVYRPKSIPNPYHGIWGNDNGAWDRFFLPYHSSFGDAIDDGLVSLGPVQQGQVVPDAGQVGIVRLLTAIYNGDLGAVPPLGGPTNNGPVNGSAIYFDGQLVTRFTDSSDASAAQTAFALGWDGDSGAFDGDIAEVIVYSRALNGCEVQQVNRYLSDKYNGGFADLPAPGGVALNPTCGLTLWLKADGEISEVGGSVDTWFDQSGYGFQATQAISGSQPTLLPNSLNGNPEIRFDGTDDEMTIPGGILGATRTHTDLNVYLVNRTNVVQDSFVFREGRGSVPADRISLHLPYSDGTMYWDAGNTDPGSNRLATSWSSQIGTPNVWGFLLSTTATALGLRQDIVQDGLAMITDDTAISFQGNGSDFSIGYGQVEGQYHNGDIAEMIVYTDSLSFTEHGQIQSYLAIKYGITLGTSAIPVDYLDSSANTLWNGITNSMYQNDIGGIGRDDASALDQRVTRSINSDALVTVDNGGPFSADQSFLLWGNNNLTTSVVITAGMHLHMGRAWKVGEAGTVGAISLGIPNTNPVDTLFVDSDNEFSDATAIPLVDDGLGNLTASVDFTDGQFFTFGEVLPPTAVTVGTLGSQSNPAGLPLLLAGLLLGTVALLALRRRK